MNEITKKASAILFDPTIGKITTFIVSILVIAGLIRLLNRVWLGKISDTSSRYKMRKFANFLGFLVIVFCATLIFSDKLKSLTVAFGVAGAGIAFALQEVIASVAGWVAINFNNFFKVGDRVMLGGIKGDVIDIGVLRTTLMEVGDWVKGDLYNGRTVRISNSFVFKDPVFNYSAEYPFLWDEINIPLHFSSDLDYARELIEQEAKDVVAKYEPEAKENWNDLINKFMLENARIEHFSSMVADENNVVFTLRYVTNFKLRRKTKDELFSRIIRRIKSSDGKVVWAYSSMELTTGDSFKIQKS